MATRSHNKNNSQAGHQKKLEKSKKSKAYPVRASMRLYLRHSKATRKLPGERALREIRHHQKNVELLLQREPFRRVARKISDGCLGVRPTRWQAAAFDALQEAAEAFLVGLFRGTQRAAIHAGRVTIMARDMQYAVSQ